MVSQDLLSPDARQKFRDAIGMNLGWREIQWMFDGAGLKPTEMSEYERSQLGLARQGLVEEYFRGIDWTDPAQVAKVLPLLCGALHDPEIPPWQRKDLRELIEREGYVEKHDTLVRVAPQS